MKLSLCQIAAVLCTLTIGILTVTPFVSTIEADDYWSEVDIYYDVKTCDRGYSHGKVITDTYPRGFTFHEPETHEPSEHSYIYNHYYYNVTVKCDGRQHNTGNDLGYTWG